MGELAEAKPLMEEALQARREALGNEHPDTLISMGSVGKLLKDMGQRAEALALLRELHAAQPPYAADVLEVVRELEAM